MPVSPAYDDRDEEERLNDAIAQLTESIDRMDRSPRLNRLTAKWDQIIAAARDNNEIRKMLVSHGYSLSDMGLPPLDGETP